MGCATGFVKYLVFISNLIFALAGLALIIIGILFKLRLSEVTKVLPSDFGLAPVLSIVVGAIVFVTAFLGCCGAVKESPCMLTTFAIILLTIFIVQVAIGVYAFLKIRNTDEFKRESHKAMAEVFSNYSKGHEVVDATQTWLHCCGLDSPSSWRNFSLPVSCCGDYNGQKPKDCNMNSSTRYDLGCSDALYDLLTSSSQVVGGVVIGIAAVEIIGAIFGLCLASSIRNHYRRNIYA